VPSDTVNEPTGSERVFLTNTLISDAYYAIHWANERMEATVPPVEPDEEELIVPMHGYLLPIGIAIREDNAFGVREGSPTVEGLCSFSLTIDGQPVYMPTEADRPGTARDTLIYLSYLVDKFLKHPVRWWDRATWEDRPVSYRGVPARIKDYVIRGGWVELRPEQGQTFPQAYFADDPFYDKLTLWVSWQATDVTWTRETGETTVNSKAEGREINRGD
jgi:hypothetical protein